MPAKKQIGKLANYKIYESTDLTDDNMIATMSANLAAFVFAQRSADVDLMLVASRAMGNLTRAILGDSSFYTGMRRFSSDIARWEGKIGGANGEIPEDIALMFADESSLERYIEAKIERDKESAQAAGGIEQGS